jgi:membrane protease YdiL (CAAX protease family)
MAIGLAPVAEEILFRGILYPLMRRISNPCAAIWVTSVIFGVFHMNAMTFLPLTLLGATLALLYEKTGNLMSPILAHSLFNLANFFLLVFPTADGGG